MVVLGSVVGKVPRGALLCEKRGGSFRGLCLREDKEVLLPFSGGHGSFGAAPVLHR